MKNTFDFQGQTVLLACAGCSFGEYLARAYAASGARVIVMDRDESRALQIAVAAPAVIEPLRLDTLRASEVRQLGAVWQDEPIDVLIHVQALREPRRLGSVIAAVPALTRTLRVGLSEGRGDVLVLSEAISVGAQPEAQGFAAGLGRMIEALDTEMKASTGRVNSLQLRAWQSSDADLGRACQAALYLTSGVSAGVSGSMLTVSCAAD